MNIPKVSVATITYNHGNFIAKAIQSVVSQKTNFEFEMVIGEDCSTDSTRQIVLDFHRRYPQIIKPLLHDKNIGGKENFISVLKHCRGEYIAILDGDDIMLPTKLQKQADVLDNNPDCVIVYHDIRVFDSDTGNTLYYFNQNYKKKISTIEDIVRYGTFIGQLSKMFRTSSGHTEEDFRDIRNLKIAGDWLYHIQNARYGKVAYIDEVLAEWRKHIGGYSSLSDDASLKAVLSDHEFTLRCAEKYGVSKELIDERLKLTYFQYVDKMFSRKKMSEFKKYISLTGNGEIFFGKTHLDYYYFRHFPLLLYYLYKLRNCLYRFRKWVVG